MPERYAFRTTKDSADRIIDEDLGKYPLENGVRSARIRELIRKGLVAEAGELVAKLRPDVSIEDVRDRWEKAARSGTRFIVPVRDGRNKPPTDQPRNTAETPATDRIKNNLLEDAYD